MNAASYCCMVGDVTLPLELLLSFKELVELGGGWSVVNMGEEPSDELECRCLISVLRCCGGVPCPELFPGLLYPGVR